MNILFARLWRHLGSINLTVVLCLLLTVDLVCGYFCLGHHTALFIPLNDMGLIPWSQTYGSHNLLHTGWFFLLLVLLFLLAINTFACTTSRVIQLSQSSGTGGRLRLVLRLAPHSMHYGLIVILAGYLCSYLFTQVLTSRTLAPGTRLLLPNASGQVSLLAFEPEYYQGKRLAFWKDEVIAARARLQLSDVHGEQREAILSCNKPVRFNGYSLHLIDFAPKSLRGMKMKPRIDLVVRKDSGVPLSLAGMALFSLGLLLYLYQWTISREANRE